MDTQTEIWNNLNIPSLTNNCTQFILIIDLQRFFVQKGQSPLKLKGSFYECRHFSLCFHFSSNNKHFLFIRKPVMKTFSRNKTWFQCAAIKFKCCETKINKKKKKNKHNLSRRMSQIFAISISFFIFASSSV